jgi:uncharacterized membrane protein YhaH (DUF805 family)
MNWYLKVWQQFSDFNSRARRREYWIFALFQIMAIIAAIILDNLLGISIDDSGMGPIYLIYILMSIVPNLAVSVRRLHDIGKSGWMILVGIIPIAGSIWLIVLFALEGDSGRNRFGPDPKLA